MKWNQELAAQIEVDENLPGLTSLIDTLADVEEKHLNPEEFIFRLDNDVVYFSAADPENEDDAEGIAIDSTPAHILESLMRCAGFQAEGV